MGPNRLEKHLFWKLKHEKNRKWPFGEMKTLSEKSHTAENKTQKVDP